MGSVKVVCNLGYSVVLRVYCRVLRVLWGLFRSAPHPESSPREVLEDPPALELAPETDQARPLRVVVIGSHVGSSHPPQPTPF